MDKPSFTVWIDPKTQVYKVDFNPQEVTPAEYGVVFASLIIHIAKLFNENNAEFPVESIVSQITKGLSAGLEQLRDVPLPTKAH